MLTPSSHRTRTGTRIASVFLSSLLLVGHGAGAECGNPPAIDATLRRLNVERAQGVPCHRAGTDGPAGPLRWSTGLAAVAQASAQDMAQRGQLGHRNSAGDTLHTRLLANGYRFSMAVENIGVGFDSADSAIDAWLASGTHCANLMNASVVEFGLACSDAGPDTQDRYWTLVLGTPPLIEVAAASSRRP